MDTPDKGPIQVSGWMEQAGTSFDHAAQNGVQLKTYELFNCGNFHLICLGYN